MKVIPAIDLMDGKVVRLYKGDPAQKTVYSDSPVDVAIQWESDGADMLHIVDLDATLGLGSNLEIIKKILKRVTVPVQVAGGLREKSLIIDTAKISQRITLGTLAFEDKSTLQSLLAELGSKKIVISVDHKDGLIVTHGWQKNSQIKLVDAVQEFLSMGFTEFLLTSINHDGTLQGPDLQFLAKVCDLPGANVIASGGISNKKDISDVKERNAYGVILGKALYDKKITIGEAKILS